MTREVLNKANDLNQDIENIKKVLAEKEEQKWIRVISPKRTELFYSMRFQKELAEWLEQKKEEYQKELESL